MLAVMCKFGECYDKVFKTFIVRVFLWKYSLIQTDIHIWQPALQLRFLDAWEIIVKPQKYGWNI